MKKKILIPTDFSKNAWSAISYALELYSEEPCGFYLLHVLTPAAYPAGNPLIAESDIVLENARTKAEESMERLLKKLSFRDAYLKHQYETEIMAGPLLDAISAFVAQRDIELIVMGTKGQAASKEVFFGSNTIAVMESLRTCPVLAIPPDTIFQIPQEIVFPTDYKIPIKYRELYYLVEITQLTGASIRILHIAEEPSLSETQKRNRELLKEYFEGLDHSFHILHQTDVTTGVDCFVQSRESDMIAFINTKHSLFNKIFSRPLVKSLGLQSKVPVFALHDLKN